MNKIICWIFGHRADNIKLDPDYFMKNMALTCNRCGYKENILERIEKYSSTFPIFYGRGFREPKE